MKNLTKRDKILLIISGVILLVVTIFVSAFWDTAYSIFQRMLNGVDLVEEYIQSFGITGVIAMMMIMVFSFFVPVVSSVPVQVACGISYGFWGGSIIVWLSMFIATQLLYLFRQNLRAFSSPKQIEKRKELEKLIKDSNRNIYFAIMLAYVMPAIPFLVICNLAASGLKYEKYTLITSLGMIPDILVTLFLGKKLLSSSPTASIITLIAIITIIVLSIIFSDKLVYLAFSSKKKNKDNAEKEAK